ncbi:enoyl-CoA hydratase/isomerase family protein [Williamsia sterculiae]|uniref:Enoyl-CoA hydratase/carnithine racemase n=1 Tax=Williamsia sterculiae TaxID=1344003 RepID=A0A1N7DXU0_9NOCA|nr:enoyl-CoA hydratase/isomerase family protein [Williamsia sterculiae]SIR80608.1 Enoyl-CoA hydratase/carnithine racemase [Williamsia sterculiae]
MPYLIRSDEIWELQLGTEGVELDEQNPDNRFSDVWLSTITELLEVIVAERPSGVVLTATGKFFSNGLDVEFIAANANALPAYLDRVHAVYRAVLTLPVPTVAAINGHAFGAGAMLALCTDHRVMRTERGYFSLPEVLLGMPFTRGMASLLRTRLTDSTASEAMFTGRRYGAQEAWDAGIVHATADVADLVDSARAVATERAATAGSPLGVIKAGLYAPLLADLAVATPPSLV